MSYIPLIPPPTLSPARRTPSDWLGRGRGKGADVLDPGPTVNARAYRHADCGGGETGSNQTDADERERGGRGLYHAFKKNHLISCENVTLAAGED